MKKLLSILMLLALSGPVLALTSTCVPMIFCNSQAVCTNVPNNWYISYFGGEGSYHLETAYYQLPYINGYIGHQGPTALPNSVACLYTTYNSRGKLLEATITPTRQNNPTWFADFTSNTGWDRSAIKSKKGTCSAPNVCQFTTDIPSAI